MSIFKVVLLASTAALAMTGCATFSPDGRSAFGETRQPPPPSPEQIANNRRDTRLSDLEETNRSLRREIEDISASINNVSSRADNYGRQSDSRGADIAALRTEVTALRQQIDAVNAKVDAIPGTLSKLLEEQRRGIMTNVDQNIRTAVANIPRSTPRQQSSSSSSGSGKFYEHEVQSGQTLSEIARAYDVSVSEVMRENNIKNESVIRVGQKLLIPVK